MNNRKEKLIEEIRHAGPLTEQDRKELGSILSTPIMQRMLFSVLQNSDEAMLMLGNADFTTESGVKQAIIIQARARANSMIVEELVEFVTTEDQPKEGETNANA